MTVLSPRLDYVLATSGYAVAVLLVVAGLLAVGAAGWTHANPPTTEVTDRTEVQTVEAEVHSNAVVVTGNSSLYSEGTRLRDEPVYLREATPTAELNLTTGTPPGVPTEVTQRIELVYAATRGGETFWERSRTLASDEATVEDGALTTRTTLDPAAISERRQQLADEIGDAGSVRVTLRAAVDYETDRYAGDLATPVPLEIADSWYTVSPASAERSHDTPVTRTVTVPRTDRRYQLLGAAGGVGVVVGLAVAGYRFVLGRRYEDGVLAHRVHRARYGEWISAGTLPAGPRDGSVAVASLEDLVDVAIDTDSRVIHDADRETYCVLAGDVTYYFEADNV